MEFLTTKYKIMENLKKLIKDYRQERQKLLIESETCKNLSNFYYLDGRTTTLQIVILDLEELLKIISSNV